jgi:hypothetical protein
MVYNQRKNFYVMNDIADFMLEYVLLLIIGIGVLSYLFFNKHVRLT